MMADGDLVGAKEEIEGILAENPSDERALNLLGMIFFKIGEYKRSAEIFEQLIESNPQVVALYVNAGLSHLKTGNYEKALGFFEKALKLNPTSRNILNYTGYALSKMGRYEEAKEMFLRAGSTKMVEEMNKKIEESGRPVFEETGDMSEELQKEEVKREGEYLIINLKAGLYTFMENIVALKGELEIKPIKKRFEKKELKSFFKINGNQIYCIRGEGEAIVKSKGLNTYTLDGEMWVNENFLAGFAGDLDWENARISTGSEGFINVVVLKGRGHAFLKGSEELRKVVIRDEDLMVKTSSLIGWIGNFSFGQVKVFDEKVLFLIVKGKGEVFIK